MDEIKRDSFIFYRSFYESINALPIENQLNIYKAIASLSLNGEHEELQGIECAIFTLIKPQIKANNKKYLNGKMPKNSSEEKAKDKQSKSKIEANNKQSKRKTQANEECLMNNEECLMNNEKIIKPFEVMLNTYTKNESLKNKINEFIIFRKNIKKPMENASFETWCKKLSKISNNDDQTKIEIIDESIAMGWQGIFELKKNSSNTSSNRKEDVIPDYHKKIKAGEVEEVIPITDEEKQEMENQFKALLSKEE